ncbi:50S ribosomal protein L11 [Candidatus Vidania fulgoroideae]|nr:50S ribosomal protein L11 [Candidatus Vidania fulgoroideae]
MTQVIYTVKIYIKIQQAKPNAALGAALGSKGINITQFCNKFNTITKFKKGELHPVVVTIYKDKSFKIKIKQKSTSTLIKEILQTTTNNTHLNNTMLHKIALYKLQDLNTNCIKKAIKTIKGCAKSIGLTTP